MMLPRSTSRFRAVSRFGVQVFAVVLPMSALAILGFPSDVSAITSWFDDFNDGNATDGNPEMWVPNLLLSGNYDATSGDYVLKADDPSLEQAATLVTITESVFGRDYVMSATINDKVFTNSSVRARGFTVFHSGMGVVNRFDPGTFSGVVAGINWNGILTLRRFQAGTPVEGVEWDPTDECPIPENPIDSREEIMIQTDAFETRWTMTVWRPGELQPDEPTLIYESESHPSGVSGIVFAGEVHVEQISASFGTFRFAKAADVRLFDGDMDIDSDVDFDDIAGFVLGLNSPPHYEATFGLPSVMQGDMDNDGDHDFDDIDLFIRRFTNNSPTTVAVPEPPSLLSVFVAVMVAWGLCHRPVLHGITVCGMERGHSRT